MADAPLLATVEDLGILVGEDLAPTDPKAILLLRTASAIVRGRKSPGTGQYISHIQDDVVQLDAIGGTTAFLPEFPVVEVTLVERATSTGWTTLAGTGYALDRRTGRILLREGASWHDWRPQELQVTYTHGFDETPDAISGAVLGLASRAWEIPIGVDNERIGQRSIKYLMLDSGFLPLEESALAEYRRPEVR